MGAIGLVLYTGLLQACELPAEISKLPRVRKWRGSNPSVEDPDREADSKAKPILSKLQFEAKGPSREVLLNANMGYTDKVKDLVEMGQCGQPAHSLASKEPESTLRHAGLQEAEIRALSFLDDIGEWLSPISLAVMKRVTKRHELLSKEVCQEL